MGSRAGTERAAGHGIRRAHLRCSVLLPASISQASMPRGGRRAIGHSDYPGQDNYEWALRPGPCREVYKLASNGLDVVVGL